MVVDLTKLIVAYPPNGRLGCSFRYPKERARVVRVDGNGHYTIKFQDEYLAVVPKDHVTEVSWPLSEGK